MSEGRVTNREEKTMSQDDRDGNAEAAEEPFIPYADHESVGDKVIAALLKGTEERLGFLPNSFRLYLHQPHLLRDVTRLNNTVMRHPSNVLSEEFKYKLALLISRNHGCRYCSAHEAHTMKRKFGLDDRRLEEILRLENPEDVREESAWGYAHAASQGPAFVTDDIRRRLAEHFTPKEIIEIACTLGFWALYNRVHSSLDIPLEGHVRHESHWVDLPPDR
jgi:alkylhydroperoxidase family enzyme